MKEIWGLIKIFMQVLNMKVERGATLSKYDTLLSMHMDFSERGGGWLYNK